MKKKLEAYYQTLVLLPSVYYYIGLGAICIGLFALSWFSYEPDGPSADELVIENLEFETSPDPISSITDLYANSKAKMGTKATDSLKIQSQAKQLEKAIRAIVSGQALSGSAPVSTTFKAKGIDRKRFVAKFSGDPIAVQRWQTSDSAPAFDGEKAFEKFVRNALGPWLGTSDFRISLESYSTSTNNFSIEADFVAESYGRIDTSQGIQSTAIWKTKWEIEQGVWMLRSIGVMAQEEVVAMVGGGKVFVDCTESVFQHCDTLRTQLAFSIDQWARKIPNIDVVGNHGLAIGDINQDGLDDIYVCQPHGLPNRLLIQNPDGTVEDVSQKSQLDILDESHAALMIDIDNDQDQDLVVSTDENLVLMSNRNDGTFQLEHVLPIGRNAQSITAADFDQDGDLDLYLCKFQDANRQNDILMFPTRIEDADDGGRNVLLRNDEGWEFRDATEECGITAGNRHYSRSATWLDYDLDGDQDLYVANEYSADQLLENQDGWFSDVSEAVGLKIAGRHRSVSVGEFNQDGRPDIFVATDVPLSALRQLRQVSKKLEKGAPQKKLVESLVGENQIWYTGKSGQPLKPFFLRAPIFSSQSAYSSATADLNNDGFDDLVVSNGFISRHGEEVNEFLYGNAFKSNAIELTETQSDSENPGYEFALAIAKTAHTVSDLCREGYSVSANQRNRCYFSIGSLGFANLSSLSGVDLPDDARGVATTDWDGDGDADIVMTCRSSPQIRILCNQLKSNNQFVHFDLNGTESNVDAIGARVELYLKGRETPLVKTLSAGSGNLTQSSKRLMFGVGKSASVGKAVVVWPNGKSQTFKGIVPNRRYQITEGQSLAAEKNYDRFNVVISQQSFEEPADLPRVGDRSLFYPRPPIPKLQFQTEPGKWYPIEPVRKKPILAVFWQKDADSERLIRDISLASDRFKESELDCVAAILPSTESENQQFEYLSKTTLGSKFPFRSGIAAPSTIDKIKHLSGDWFFNHQVPTAPFALLLDSSGRVAGFYSQDDLDTDKIFEDLPLVDQPDWQYRIATAPFGGRWTARYRHSKMNRLRTRFKEVGYGDDEKILLESSRSQIAFELCHKAIELDSQGDVNRARKFFEQAISMDPNCVMAYVGEGNLLRRMAHEQKFNKEESKVSLQQLALTDFEHAIGLDPMNTDAIIGRANIAIDQGRTEDALHQLTEYVQVDPSRFEVHAIIGRLLFHQKRHQEAAKFMSTAFENRPSLPFVAGDLGFLYLSAGEYEQAHKFLRLANRLQPSDKNILRLLAEAEFVTGNFDEAAQLFEQVTKLDPNRRRSKNVLAWLLATCPYESYRDGEQAMKIMNPMVEIHGDSSPAVLEIYAACFAEVGEFEQALSFQTRAVDLLASGESLETYSESQKQGMYARLELFRRKRPYRTADINQIPIQPPGGTR